MSDNYPQVGKVFLWTFLLIDATDGYTEETGISPTVTVSKNGAAFGALTGTPAVSEIGNGWYKVTVAAADMVNTVILRATGAGCRNAYLALVPGGDWLAVLVGKRVIDRPGQETSFKQPDGATEQFALTYAEIDADTFSWGP